VSRVENRSGDPAAVADLAAWLEQRISALSEQTRRRLTALPEFSAAGLSRELGPVARQIAARLQAAPATPELLALLKQPVFASVMKDQQAPVASYGPRGLLRVS
jgi:hypothetical protein